MNADIKFYASAFFCLQNNMQYTKIFHNYAFCKSIPTCRKKRKKKECKPFQLFNKKNKNDFFLKKHVEKNPPSSALIVSFTFFNKFQLIFLKLVKSCVQYMIPWIKLDYSWLLYDPMDKLDYNYSIYNPTDKAGLNLINIWSHG